MSKASSPAPPRISERKQRTHASILSAAASCFGSSGFEGASMMAIAEKADVTKPTLYAHFSSKEKLFDTLLVETLATLKDKPLPDVHSAEQMHDALLAHAKHHLDVTLAEPNLGLMRAAFSEMRRRSDWAKEFLESVEDVSFERWLAKSARKNGLQFSSPKRAAETFWSLVKGPLFYPVLLGFRSPASTRERNRVLKEALRVFMTAHTLR